MRNGIKPQTKSNVTHLTSVERIENLRILEAVLFAAGKPMAEKDLHHYINAEESVKTYLKELEAIYASRGINLVRVAGKWTFRTAEDLTGLLQTQGEGAKKLSQAALETLAIIAYHQPATRSEIEDIRGVSTSKGTLDVLMEVEWIKMRGRRKVPGRPITYGTTEHFLSHFGLDSLTDLPGLEDFKEAGLLEGTISANFSMPRPTSSDEFGEDEEPL